MNRHSNTNESTAATTATAATTTELAAADWRRKWVRSVLTWFPMLLKLDLMFHQGTSTGSIPVSIRV
ncbi:hypothetical protein TIFTF001_036013 [Ficus carica]|uniref:Uncharacterized protein n=1 Tax=Ficus carica TaxID=3494 RepID=A0AA88E2W3_FICCA|nr:hypothetical protein TIFTF001_035984 [Ficus carica]GMN66924.1 hypothetical protein TIFTF001_035992 [Ficus carica]GMN66939.1 hypothetical protein TIFTF001_036005 [Ficus carica]GMN66945.1 hypothetical protein TIFTF001_036013 [Ficus carica]